MSPPRPACLLLSLLALPGCASLDSAPPRLESLWTRPGFANPESIVASADGAGFYVSNVAGEADARDGNGFIARVDGDGRIVEREWVRGLDAPKGMALDGKRLFVSDLTVLVEIDATDGRIVARHAAPDARFLNDVALAPDGSVLASDSATGRIYAWRDGRMQPWLEAPQLRSANGLLPEPDRLVVATMQGLLLAIDWRTRAITTLASGLGDADGIARWGEGYLVSEWPGRLFHVSRGGTVSVLLDTRPGPVYLNDVLVVGDRLLVPHLEPGTLGAYRLRR